MRVIIRWASLAVLAACSRVQFVEDPRVVPNQEGALLTAWVTAETVEAQSLEITIDDGGVPRVFRSPPATTHRVLLGGMRPDTEHMVSVVATDTVRRSRSVELVHRTEALPAEFPTLVPQADPLAMEPGLTMLGIGPFLTMIDHTGTVRWAAEGPGVLHELTMTSRGTVLYQLGKQGWVEMSLSGAVIREYVAGAARPAENRVVVPLPTVHHDALEMPNGNWLVLSAERRFVEGYPTSETDPDAEPQDAWIAGDVVAEVDEAGVVVRTWSVFDALDPLRIGYGSVDSDYWDGYFGGPSRDWSHGNAVWYDSDREEVLVSLRHQDAVVAFEYDSGELSWILAPDENWPESLRPYLLERARPELVVPYHQHGAKIATTGELVLFDNGNHRTSPPVVGVPPLETASRGVAIAIDHEQGTWDTTADYGSSLQPPLFSGSLGDADLLEQTGNMLVTFGNVRNPGFPGAIIREVTRDEPPVVVFDLSLPAPLSTFRAQRVQGAFPGF